MTDASLPPGSPDDELASAVLDGEASAAERDRAAADPTFGVRLAAMARARDAIAAPVAVDDDARDDAIATAVAALVPTSTPAGPSTDAPVAPLRHRTRNRVLVALSVAAVALLAVVVPLAVRRASVFSQDSSASAPAPSGPAADRALGTTDRQPGGERGPAAAAAPSTTATALPRATVAPDSPAVVAASFLGDDLGGVADPAELRDRVAARFLLRDDVHADDGGEAHGSEEGSEDRTAAAMPSPPGSFLAPEAQPEIVARLQACDPLIRSREPGLGVVVFTASVSYEGVAALTFLYDGAPGAENRLITVDRASCATLDRQSSPR